MITLFKQYIARKALAKMVKAKRESFECERYRRNRAAQLKRRRV